MSSMTVASLDTNQKGVHFNKRENGQIRIMAQNLETDESVTVYLTEEDWKRIKEEIA